MGARKENFRDDTAVARRDESAAWDYGVVELAALSALSALGCAFATGRADLLFVAVFGASGTVTVIEALRRLR
jgi:hypothetical protein